GGRGQGEGPQAGRGDGGRLDRQRQGQEGARNFGEDLRMSDTLAKIVDDKRKHVAGRKEVCSQAECEKRAKAAEPPRGFAKALDAARTRRSLRAVSPGRGGPRSPRAATA